MPPQVFSLIFGALLVAWFFVELFLGRLGLEGLGARSDRGSWFACSLAFALGMTLAFGARTLGWFPIGAGWVPWVGLAVMICGLILRVFSILWLGPMFTRVVQIVPGHKLVTSGPYRFVRHPSYSALLLLFVGMGLALGDWLSVAVLAIVPTLGIAYRIIVEEDALLTAFGDEYRLYKVKVRALVPFLF